MTMQRLAQLRMKELGLCQQYCGREAKLGKALCEICRKKINERRRKLYKKVERTEEQKRYFSEYLKLRYKELRKLGLCVRCKKKAYPGASRCLSCAEKERSRFILKGDKTGRGRPRKILGNTTSRLNKQT